MLPKLSRIFLLKRASIETVLSIALIVAALTSMAAFANGITAKTKDLGRTETGSKTYLVLGENVLDSKSTRQETIIFATIEIENKNRTVPIRSTNIPKLLESNDLDLEGKIPDKKNEAIIGNFLARTLDIQVGENLEIEIENEKLCLKITAMVESESQINTSLLVMENFFSGTKKGEKLDLAIFSLGENGDEVLERLKSSPDGEVLGLGDVKGFISSVNQQALSLIFVWFLIGCAVVLVGSGVGTARMVEESCEELETLRSVGARRRKSFFLMLIAVVIIGLTGSLLGVSLGIVGSQIITSTAGWVIGGDILTPILGLRSLLEIGALTFVSSVGGGVVSLIYTLRGSDL